VREKDLVSLEFLVETLVEFLKSEEGGTMGTERNTMKQWVERHFYFICYHLVEIIS
jgi:hypothetical protein